MATKHVTVDASIIVGICAIEPHTYPAADEALQDYAAKGYQFHAPAVIVAEVLNALCRKLKVDQSLTSDQFRSAILDFEAMMSLFQPIPDGDVPFISRASMILGAYDFRQSNDAIYLALTDHLSTLGQTEIVTFDQRMHSLARAMAPGVRVNLLVPMNRRA
jgi:predicted nucleic acid-binding protein